MKSRPTAFLLNSTGAGKLVAGTYKTDEILFLEINHDDKGLEVKK
jgi:hypothetical protein